MRIGAIVKSWGRFSIYAAHGLLLSTVALAAGCGNQMMRQPGFRPLDSPRAAPAADAVAASPSLIPSEGRTPSSPALGASDPGTAYVMERYEPTVAEPNVPPPDLSDNARNEPAPKQLDSLRSPLPDAPWVPAAGRDMFLNRCVQCHNASGYGSGPVGGYLIPAPPDLAAQVVQRRSDGALFWSISMGQGKMPGFRNWTSPAQRWELVRFVRALKDAPPGVRASDTVAAPYPIYGKPGFERTHFAAPAPRLPDTHAGANIPIVPFYEAHSGGGHAP